MSSFMSRRRTDGCPQPCMSYSFLLVLTVRHPSPALISLTMCATGIVKLPNSRSGIAQCGLSVTNNSTVASRQCRIVGNIHSCVKVFKAPFSFGPR